MLLALCEEHFCKWHETQGEPRKALVLKLFGKPMREPKRQGGFFDAQDQADDRSDD